MFPPQSAALPTMPPFEEACFFRVSFLFRLRRDSPSKWFWTRIALANRSKWVPSPLAALCQNELGVVWYLKDNLLTACCLICSCSDADEAGVADFPAVLFYFCGGTQMKIQIEKSWVGQSTNAVVIQTLSAPSSGQASVITGLRGALHSRVRQLICSWYPDTYQLGNYTGPAGKRDSLPAEWGLV